MYNKATIRFKSFEPFEFLDKGKGNNQNQLASLPVSSKRFVVKRYNRCDFMKPE
jgi:hypothetical protein